MNNWDGSLPSRFACHMSADSRRATCAGFLAVAGGENFSVRFAVACGDIPVHMMKPGEDWPPLYTDYDAMARANGYHHHDPPNNHDES